MVPLLSLLDPANFITHFSSAEPDNPCVHRLHALLKRLDPNSAFSNQAEWLEDLAAWLFQRGRVPGRLRKDPTATARLKLLLSAFDLMPEQLIAVRAVVAHAFAVTDSVRLFTDTGLPGRQAIISEAIDRMSRRLLPEPPVDGDLSRLLFRLFPTQRAAHWFASLPADLSHQLLSALAVPCGAGLEPLRVSMRDAAVLLSVRISANGLADEVHRRLGHSSILLRDSPFLLLPKVIHNWVANTSEAGSPTEVECRASIAACRKATHDVVATLNHTGVSVDLVYRLALINRQLDRLYTLIMVLSHPPIEGAGTRLLQTLVRGGVRDRSLKNLFRSSSRLLAQRVIERAGHGGEHYLTQTRAEQHQMVTSAGGGGAITGFSVFLKFVVTWMHLPLLFEGFFLGLNYASGFVAMQLIGFTLATKQPAMTAATLAGAIKDSTRHHEADQVDLNLLVDLVARAFRSQLAAIIGNLGLVVPSIFIINLLVRGLTGHWLLDTHYAESVVSKHHPFLSASIPYAILTGVFLWMGSILGGMVENWFVVNKLHEAIASSRSLRVWVGRQRALRISQFFLKNISGFGGNISFGVILGFAPVMGTLVGIPIEVRHVTFMTGQLTFAGMTLGPEAVLHTDFLWAISSIGVIGLCNFGVSFSLALFVALRAREVSILEQLGLARAVLQHLREAPLDFFLAPAEILHDEKEEA